MHHPRREVLDERGRWSERTRQIVERDQLASCMNATKWRELFLHVPPLPLGGAMRWIGEDASSRDSHAWDVPEMLGACDRIEWIEFDPIEKQWVGALVGSRVVADHSERILEILRRINAPTSLEAGRYRVWGYLRPGTAPAWVVPAPK